MKPKLVRQGYLECGPACIAMAANIDLEQAKQLLIDQGWDPSRGAYPEQVVEVLIQLGFSFRYWSKSEIVPEALYKIKKAILAVPSLNRKGGRRYIFMQNCEILDPQTGNEGCFFYPSNTLKKRKLKIFHMIEVKRRRKKT